jgi:hypothetical protein
MLAEHAPTTHNLIKGAASTAIKPVSVVQFTRAINAKADQKVVLLEKDAPIIIKQYAVGLKSMLHHLIRPTILFNQLNRPLEELQLHQRRLSTLPRHGDRGGSMRFQQLTDIGLKSGLGHSAFLIRIKRLL